MDSDYQTLIKIMKPERILKIWETEKAEEERRKPLINAITKNDWIETLLENPKYRIVNQKPVWS